MPLIALLCSIVVGLMLPLLARVVPWTSATGTRRTQLLLLYESGIAAIGLLVAGVVAALTSGTVAGPFTIGSLDVGVHPIRWLAIAMTPNATWRSELPSLVVAVTAVTALFVWGAVRRDVTGSAIVRALPVILVAAALNAAGEEWLYRTALLRAAEGLLSTTAACMLSAVVFGVAHWRGMPGGPGGVIAAGILGFVLAQATLETRGIGVAWTVHFIQDVVIFAGLLGQSRPTTR